MKQLIECVPNFSEGRDMAVMKQITDQIETVEGVKLLDVDPGAATNRTVVTMVGTPEAVSEAAFRCIKKAMEVIDMSKHKGEHPRFGATDVCPFVPVSNITMEETAVYARKLAERVGKELGIPVYCYENAAFTEERRNLANCRSGEYEGLPKKLKDPNWKPDFGPAEFLPRTGAIAIGARDFLVAYNINLNTTSTRRANAVAFDIREKGRPVREGNPVTGKIKKDKDGNEIWESGRLKACKAIGWFIEEYGIAQVSINLTNISITPVHVAFEESCKSAQERGMRVSGSELVGLIPLRAMIDAGKYFLKKQNRSAGISEEEIIKIAVKSLGLDDLRPFNPREKIIEYILEDQDKRTRQADTGMIDNLNYIKELGFRSRRALEQGTPAAFGELMHEHWEHKRRRSAGMSNPRIDEWYELGRTNGAIGGKLVGAGGGGFLMFYAEERDRLRTAMHQAGLDEVRFRFDFDGTRVLFS